MFARAMRFGRSEFCSSTAPRCADGTDFNGQDLTWQSRSVFDTLGPPPGSPPKTYPNQLTQSNQPAFMFATHPCEFVKSVVQKSKHQIASHTHAHLATGTQSTTRPTIRRVHAQMKSAFESTRWASARLSVRTPAVTGHELETLFLVAA